MRISGNHADSAFRRYNIQSLDDFKEAAEKLATRAARLRVQNATGKATEPQGRPETEGAISETGLREPLSGEPGWRNWQTQRT